MVAVIVPAYNRADCLRNALDSLVLQTDRKFVTIVVDDCSQEEDLNIVCKEYENKLFIKYLRLDVNSGPGVARQAGIDFAASCNWEYVMFLDSDDMYMPNAVEKLAYEIKHRGDDFIFSAISVQRKHEPGFIIEPERGVRVWLHGKIFRTSFLVNNNIRFEPDLRGNEDVCFMIKCTALAKKMSFINDTVYLWRDENNSITRQSGTARDGVISLDYIKAVCRAIFFLEGSVNLKQYVQYIFYCYNYYEVAKYKGFDMTEADELLTRLCGIEALNKEMKKIKTWEDSFTNINQFKVIDKEIIKFTESFFDWLKRFGIEVEL